MSKLTRPSDALLLAKDKGTLNEMTEHSFVSGSGDGEMTEYYYNHLFDKDDGSSITWSNMSQELIIHFDKPCYIWRYGRGRSYGSPLLIKNINTGAIVNDESNQYVYSTWEYFCKIPKRGDYSFKILEKKDYGRGDREWFLQEIETINIPATENSDELVTSQELLMACAYVKDYVDKQPSGGTVDTEMSDTSTNAVQNKVIKTYVDGQVTTLQTSFQNGVDSIYNAIVAQGTTPTSKSLSDVTTGIGTMANNKYSNGQANGKSTYEPTSATLSDDGVMSAKNSSNIEVFSKTFTNNYNAGVSATKVGTASASNVLSGKTFTNSSSVGITGTMTNHGDFSVDSFVQAPGSESAQPPLIPMSIQADGYVDNIVIQPAYSSYLNANNIKKGVTIFGVTGNVENNGFSGTFEYGLSTNTFTVTIPTTNDIKSLLLIRYNINNVTPADGAYSYYDSHKIVRQNNYANSLLQSVSGNTFTISGYANLNFRYEYFATT